MLDVLGSHAVRPTVAGDSSDGHNHNFTIINPREVLKTIWSPPTTASSTDTDDDPDVSELKPSPVPPTDTMDLKPDKPVMLYILRETTGEGVLVMNLLPSLNVLQNNEVCHISAGNEDNLFGFRDRKGISSLHFLRHVDKRQVRLVEIFCRPVINGASMPVDGDIRLDNFSITLELHII